ncbi:peptidyl-tRNA hydrolase ICT1, mitochondrial [Engraulis encrasicolus]|uniref:peptidyl-tRNA hydrolase ICT1, mitochondrial n=1 Tax=Engraulis encrasicolus TaxID=184585 RepID=UPI002FD0AEFB
MFLVRQLRHKAFVVPCMRLALPLPSAAYGSSSNSRSGGDSDQDGQTGHQVPIPVDRLKISYSRSSGPGGQHVNKVNSKAEVRFHVATADWIPEEVRWELLKKCAGRVNKSGELVVVSEVSRSQHRNLAECLTKIQQLIEEASYTPPPPSEEDIALRRQRLEKSNRERLRQKKLASGLKQSRRGDLD